MNPVWEEQRTLDPPHLSSANNSMGTVSRTTNQLESYCESTRFIVDQPHIGFVMNAGTERLSPPPPPDWRNEESAAEDPDGDLLELGDEDPELVRKRRQLQAIEEQIMLKKAAIALKMVNPMTLPGPSCDKQSAEDNNTNLRDRVNSILHQHPAHSMRSKVQSSCSKSHRMSSSFPRQTDHPLKLRVNSLLRRRRPDPPSEVPAVLPPLPLSQSFITSPEGENGINKGFLRFLDVLNKGVDINMLSWIVNNNTDALTSHDEVLNTKVSVVESNPDVGCSKKSQMTSSDANPLAQSYSSREKMVSLETSHSDGRSLLIEEMTNKRGGGHALGSRSPSTSPPAKVKRKEEEKKKKAKLKEQQEHLQNILNTLGLSLEVDEMSRLADRTQERLYGKKSSTDQEPNGQDAESHRSDRRSSSPPSPSSPFKSACSESSPSRGDHKVSDLQDVYQDREESHSCQTNPSPAQPPAFFQNTILAQFPQYDAYHNGMHGSPAHMDWTSIQGESLPSKHAVTGFSYPKFPIPVPQPCKPEKQPQTFSDWELHLNPDLSMSEGQTNSVRPRCLAQVKRYFTKTKNCPKKKKKNRRERRQRKRERDKQKKEAEQV